jgi:hypothetical protein
MSATQPGNAQIPVVEEDSAPGNARTVAEKLLRRYVQQVPLRDRSKESIREFLYKTVHNNKLDMWKSSSSLEAMEVVMKLESEDIPYLHRDRDTWHSASSEIVNQKTDSSVIATKKRTVDSEHEPTIATPTKLQRTETPVYTGPTYLVVRYDGKVTEYYDEEELRSDALGLLKCIDKGLEVEDAATMPLDTLLKMARQCSDEYSKTSPRCLAFRHVVKVQQLW